MTDFEFIESFKEKLGEDGECWPFLGSKNKDNYGQLTFRGRTHLAHRVSYTLFKWEIPKGMYVCHHCDNPICCNPYHLYIGTQKDNMRDMITRGRQNRHKPLGETNHFAVLNSEKVIEIRELKARTYMSDYKIAKMFGVSRATIQLIVTRKTWTHI